MSKKYEYGEKMPKRIFEKDEKIEILDLEEPKLENIKKPKKNRLLFAVDKKKKSFMNQKEEIEILDFDDIVFKRI